MKKYLKISSNLLLWILGIVFAILFLVLVTLQIPAVQNLAKEKLVAFVQQKVKTKVVVGSLEIGFPKKIILNNFYFEDQQKDTLLAGQKLAIDLNFLDLINQKITLNQIDLEGITASVNRDTHAVFNFDYILKAFASKDSLQTPKEAKPTAFLIENIRFKNIKIQYSDAYTGQNVKLKLGILDTKIRKQNWNTLDFEVPKIKIQALQLAVLQATTSTQKQTPRTPKTKPTDPQFNLDLGEIDFSKFDLQYTDLKSKIAAALKFKKLKATFRKTDLGNQFFLVDRIYFSDAKAKVTIDQVTPPTNTANTASTTSPKNKLEFKIKQTTFNNVDLVFDNTNSIPAASAIDYQHLNIQDAHLDLTDLNYSPLAIQGNLNQLRLKEKSGVEITQLSTAFYYGTKNAYLKNLVLKTPQSLIKDHLEIGYPSVAALSQNSAQISVNAHLKESRLSLKDVLLFAPALAQSAPFKGNKNAVLSINGALTGKLNRLSIPNLEISGIRDTKIAASGTITGLQDINKAYFDLVIKQLQSGATDLPYFIPKGSIPSALELPAYLNVNGTFQGTTTHFNTNLVLKSSYGEATIKALLDQKTKNSENYTAQLYLKNFDLGKLFKTKTLGKISLKAQTSGIGLNPKTAQAQLKARILKLDYNNYAYSNLVVNGSIDHGLFTATAGIQNPDLRFDLVSSGSFKDKYPAVKAHLNVDIADLEKLNLHAGPLKIRGTMNAAIASASLDNLKGKVDIIQLTVADAEQQFVTDTISLSARVLPDTSAVVLKSPFLNASVRGNYTLTTITAALKNSLSVYYAPKPILAAKNKTEQNLDFQIEVKDSPLLHKIMPQVQVLEPFFISGSYHSKKDSIIVNGKIPKLLYGQNTITNAILNVSTKDKTLFYDFAIDSLQNNQLQLPATAIKGQLKDQTATYQLELKDSNDTLRYSVAGTLKTTPRNTEVHLDPSTLILNYKPWTIAATNLIQFGKTGIQARDFKLNNSKSSLEIASLSTKKNAPLSVTFADFEIKTIRNWIQKDSLQFNGTLNGSATIQNATKNPVFKAALKVEDFSFRNDTLGSIDLEIENSRANTYTTKIALSGQDNQLNLDGTYHTNTANLDLKLAIEKLHLKSIQGFTMGNLKESTGFINGSLALTGTINQPQLVGSLNFNQIGFRVTPLNSVFKDTNNTLKFSGETIGFDAFTLKDENNNTLVLNGTISTTDASNPAFNLTVDATNFKAINSEEKDNDLYYGALYLDNHLRIKGDWNNPMVDGNLKINANTDFVLVLPQSDPSIADREGIVSFVDADNPPLITKITTQEKLRETAIKGINAAVNIEIDKKAALTMVLDKANGDFLKLKGQAQLSGGIDPSGKTNLTGRYEIQEGTYEMNFNLINRKFEIKKGSYLLWTGEPTSAEVAITAVYKNEVAPIDLVDSQLAGTTSAVRNTYKQKIPFETELLMKGELLQPSIHFDIVLPEGNNNVATEIISTTQAKLSQLRQQPEELNKQVFALLLLNRFIGENPFASQAGGSSVSSLARESVSKILSQQLNNFAAELVDGVAIEFDLDATEDYTTGNLENRTDLNVGISKKLLDDRLKVTVGSRFGLEGPQQQNQAANSIAGDVSVEYQISKDGRYKLRAYRLNKYQVALQGQVVETGVSFVLTLDYNQFKELFHSKKTAE
ncbi:translocation/assembly module TamB domain-containing protein [Flavobacterium crassostreae]|uniref:Translocation and assembly module TamB C-terminal domain-containing protein n=1 Tax=Flavobacterium crassostreae TaxID=1763534 RepID=A0A1B9E9Z0_9FLAO|nr:translocation/assembly module TamB domain-containing protein [Flavobacterium crassostreae]OCB78777.1 hypothetical protein LPBF_01955 [Flavobacterium crassostreae]